MIRCLTKSRCVEQRTVTDKCGKPPHTCESAVVRVGGQLPAGLRNAGRTVGHAGQQQTELVRQQLLAGHGVHAECRQRFHHRVVAVGQRRVGVVARLVVVIFDVQAGQFRVLDAQLAARRVYVLPVQGLCIGQQKLT